MSLWQGIRERWQQRQHLNDNSVAHLTNDFLPPVLAIQQQPPHPASRYVARILMAVFVFGVLWASLGHVDIIATAQGKIIPQSRVKVIQPMELGKVSAIHVAEGQIVGQGEVLIELDTVQAGADVQRLQQELDDTQFRLQGFSRLLQAVSELAQGKDVNPSLPEIMPTEYQLWARSLWHDLREQRRTLQQEKATLAHNASTSQALIEKYQQTLPIIQQRAESLRDLAERQLSSDMEYLDVEQQRINVQQDLAAEQAKLAAVQSQIQGVEAQLASYLSTTEKEWQQLSLDLRRQQLSLQQEQAKAHDRLQKQTLVSPVEGVVKNLSITTLGGVVSPADEIMSIVPTGDVLQVEAFIDNKDRGFIHEGQLAEVKVNTYNFTKYGIIEGELIHVSDDSIKDEQKGYLFPLRVSLKRDHLLYNGQQLALQPGMEVTVEIKTGTRRLIEFFLSPVLRYGNESLRER